MTINQLSIFIENKEGKLAELTSTLAREGIDIRAMSVADTQDFGILRLIVSDCDRAINVLKEAGCVVSVTQVLAVAIPDFPGSLAKVSHILADNHINIEIHRDPGCTTRSCIGSGRTDASAEIPVSGTGYVLAVHAAEGDSVQKGDLLFELAAQDADNTLRSAVLTAPAGGAVELSAVSGMQAYKGQLLARIHDLTEMEVVASVDEMDLDLVREGSSVTVLFDRYPGEEVQGTVVSISRIGMARQNAAYYDVTISVSTQLEVLPGMNAVVRLK